MSGSVHDVLMGALPRLRHEPTAKRVRAVLDGATVVDTRRALQIGIRGSLYGSEDRGGARALGLHLIPTEELLQRGVDAVLPEVHQRIGSGPVFLSFDIDFVDPGFAPGTGTPEVGGPSSRDALRLVRGLRGIEFVGFSARSTVLRPLSSRWASHCLCSTSHLSRDKASSALPPALTWRQVSACS